MPRADLLACVLALVAVPLAAEPLPDMAGAWTGAGVAREAPGGPEEPIRCRLENDWQAERQRLRVRGRCAVPGRTVEIDGALIVDGSGELSGFWRNPVGPGQTSLSGRTGGDRATFAFRAEDGSGRDVSQIVRLRIADGTLMFDSRSLGDERPMGSITFRR